MFIEPTTPLPPDREPVKLPDDPEFRRALRAWDEGPIRYIILKEEQNLFRSLTTDEDRLQFIEDFWARRDRSPESPENEYRLEFWRRVADVDRQFIDTPGPGWKTDRGRIWIVMGPPDQVENFAERSKGPGVLRWIYRNRPNLYLEPNFIVAFRNSPSGEWELSSHPQDFDPVFRDLESSVRPLPSSATLPFQSTVPKMRREPTLSRLSLYLDLGQAMAPPELYRLREASPQVETQEIFGTMDVRTSFEFLGPAPEGKVRTGIVVGILKGSLASETDDQEADSSVWIDVSIYPGEIEDPEQVVRLTDRFGPSRENYVVPLAGRLLFRAETALDPGPHLMVYRLLDRSTGQAAQARETITVPERFRSGLSLSTVVLASLLAPVDPARERPDSFTLGRFRIVPNLEATYRNGEVFAFFYQVHGAAPDPRTGRQRLDLEYAFAAQQGASWLALGDPLIYRDQENPQGWSVPLTNWPPASYRLTVTVTDVVSGERTFGTASFRVVPGS